MTKWYNDKFWHQKYVDLWTVPHTVFGATVVFLFAYLGWDIVLGLAITVILAILWEIAEVVTGVATEEILSNKVTDVVVAALGYVIAWFAMINYGWNQGELLNILLLTTIILVATSAIGWLGYHYWHTR